jgi:hypothetical protein
MPVHPGAAAVEQDRPAGPVGDGAVDGPADRRGQRDQDDLGALAARAQDPVTVLLTQITDVSAGGFEDPQSERIWAYHDGVDLGGPAMARVARDYGYTLAELRKL